MPTDTAMLEMFTCVRRSMTLSKAGCSRLWQSSHDDKPAVWEGRHTCRSCTLGARHAGKQPTNMVAADAWALVCGRCTRPAERLIGGRLCVSSWNRHREAMVGRNCKGGRPLLLDRLRTQRVAVSESGAARIVEEAHVLGAAEILVHLARTASGPIAFGWGNLNE